MQKSYLIALTETDYDLRDPQEDFPNNSSYGIMGKPICLIDASSPEEALKLWMEQQSFDEIIKENLWNNYSPNIFKDYTIHIFEAKPVKIATSQWQAKFIKACKADVKKDRLEDAAAKKQKKRRQRTCPLPRTKDKV